MPIDESYKRTSLERLEKVANSVREKLQEILEDIDPEDLDYGLSEEVKWEELKELWEEGVEKNNYMEVVYTEVMEHHDGAYLKATFRNSLGDTYADRYVSVWSSGRVDVSHALFVKLESVSVRIERVKEDTYKLFIKSV